jgi:hypothetical protein
MYNPHLDKLRRYANAKFTSLSEARKAKRGAVYRCKKKDGDDYPLAIFKFIYRSQGTRVSSPSPFSQSLT